MPQKNGRAEKKAKAMTNQNKVSSGKQTGNNMKMTMTASPMAPRMNRKVLRAATKRLNGNHHNRNFSIGKGRSGILRMPGTLDPCENSNDSGLGFDHNMDYPLLGRNKFLDQREYGSWANENHPDAPNPRKRKLEIKVETDETNDNYGFPENTASCKETTSLIRSAPTSVISSLGRSGNHNSSPARSVPRCIPLNNRRAPSGPITLTTQLSNISRGGKVQLQIVCQPEQQHRARYQTEGSRGAVKDRTGNGFPVVKLIGYDKPATLQVFIGTDMGRVAPHMFYQACRVSGKNSTPCVEKKIEGTIVIEVELDPSKEMMVTCDCVGILKERNVDVEHRFPDQSGPRSKKKSTRCRMVFRTTITHDDGTTETLQTSSQPIVCTQPPGVPEICKKSLTMCPTTGNVELFVLGKNFLKDTRVVFQQSRNDQTDRDILWEETVTPDKEYLQQTHLVCVIPPYIRHDIVEPVAVSLFVVSSGKTSEPHQFLYTPSPPSTSSTVPSSSSYINSSREDIRPMMIWQTLPDITPKAELDVGMMPPPTSLMPLSQRRPSTNTMSMIVPEALKTEMLDENSNSQSSDRFNENSLDVHAGDSNMGSMSDNSMDGTSMIRHSTMLSNSNPMSMILSHENSLSMKTENSLDMNLARQSSLNLSMNETLVHHGPISMALHNDNSVDLNILRRSTIHNENSMDGTQMNDTIDILRHSENSNMSIIANENSMDAMSNRRVAEVPMEMETHTSVPFNQTTIMPNNTVTLIGSDELKGIDLRMKAPMATGADLIHTQSPSMATLRRFGVTEPANGPLPAQSAQSVENYLTTIENNKQLQLNNHRSILPPTGPKMINDTQPNVIFNNTASFSTNDGQISQLNGLLTASRETNPNKPPTSLYPEPDLTAPQTIANDILASTNLSNSNIIHTNLTESQLNPNTALHHPSLIAENPPALIPSMYTTSVKNDVADLAVLQPVITDSLLLSQVQAQRNASAETAARLDALVVSTMESSILNSTAKLDALVNSTVDTHMGSPHTSDLSPNNSPNQHVSRHTSPVHLNQQPSPNHPDNLLATSPHDVIINTQPPTQATDLLNTTPQVTSAALSPEIILNPQVSPSLICHNGTTNQENLLLNSQVTNALNNLCQGASLNVPNSLIPSTSLEPVLSPTRRVAVKNILLGGLNTQQQLAARETLKNLLEEQQSLENSPPQSLIFPSEEPNSASQSFSTASNIMAEGSQQNTFLSQPQFDAIVPTAQPAQPSILPPDSKAVIPVPVKEIITENGNLAVPSSVTTAATTVKEPLITQEITTMSDTDLLSYINPSCFDQGTYPS